MHCLVKGAGGLDDEIVQARLGCVDRDAGHDVGKTDSRVAAGELGSAKRRPLDSRCTESPGATRLQCSRRPGNASACSVGSPAVRLRVRAPCGSRLITFLARSNSQASSRSLGGWEHMRQ